jgi:hypothetical protein
MDDNTRTPYVIRHFVLDRAPGPSGGTQRVSGIEAEDYRGKRSAAFAFIEASTGMGIEAEWLDVEEAPVIILDHWDEA